MFFNSARVLILLLSLSNFAFASGGGDKNDGLDAWIRFQKSLCERSLAKAIGPEGGAPGSVMASPSKEAPNYFFHWIRDAALVSKEIVLQLRDAIASKNIQARDESLKKLLDYVDFSRRNQLTDNPAGTVGGTGLGEAKFEIDGRAFLGPWGRPQNDGPALRAITAMELAETLSKLGMGNVVKEKLYRAEIPANTLIKADLEYISHHWREASVDPWEEVRGDHFYVRLSQYEALKRGASFAYRFNDTKAAAWYQEQADLIKESLKAFWDPNRGIIRVSLNEQGGDRGKTSGIDIQVILGILHSEPVGGLYPVDHPQVISTVEAMVERFNQIYTINRTATTDRDGYAMSPAIGRYPEDTYDGVTIDGRGNPWFLATQAMAEYHYLLAAKLKLLNEIKVTQETSRFFGVAVGARIKKSDPRFAKIIQDLEEKAEGFVRRSRYHTDNAGNQSEQFNRENGYMQGARDLTWSYASFLSMIRARDREQGRY